MPSWARLIPRAGRRLAAAKKNEMRFQKSISPIFNRQYAVTPPAQNSSIHSMFALQGSGFTPVVAQTCHLNKNPISSLNFRIVNIYLKGMENL